MKKITLATIKSFIKREFKNGNLYAKGLSDFDGMVDCVMPIKDKDFTKVESIDMTKKNTYGIKQTWFVRGSMDRFRPFDDGNFTGYEITNCCGSCLITMRRLY